MLIPPAIPDTQAQLSVFKRGSTVISIGISDTSAKIHFAVLPLLTHYNGMLAHCKQGLEWLVCLSMFLIYFNNET